VLIARNEDQAMRHSKLHRALLTFAIVVSATSFPGAFLLWLRAGERAVAESEDM
jgi:hypothetical protein